MTGNDAALCGGYQMRHHGLFGFIGAKPLAHFSAVEAVHRAIHGDVPGARLTCRCDQLPAKRGIWGDLGAKLRSRRRTLRAHILAATAVIPAATGIPMTAGLYFFASLSKSCRGRWIAALNLARWPGSCSSMAMLNLSG